MKTATVADALPEIICQEFQIPAEFHHLIRAVDGAYSDGRVDTVLSIGCNHKGMLPREADYIDRIKRELFNGVDPEWVLCPMRWCWTPDSTWTSLLSFFLLIWSASRATNSKCSTEENICLRHPSYRCHSCMMPLNVNETTTCRNVIPVMPALVSKCICESSNLCPFSDLSSLTAAALEVVFRCNSNER